MKYLSLDIETTGLDSETHQILEVGAIIEDTENELMYDDVPKFRAIIEHDNYTGNPFAINMNQRLFKILADIPTDYGAKLIYKTDHNILTENIFMLDFYNWLNEYFNLNMVSDIKEHELFEATPVKIIVAGKNVSGFDLKFLNKLPYFEEVIKTHHRTIDPSMLFTDMKVDEAPVSLQTCINRANIKGIVSHDALQDAWDVIRVLRTKY